MTIWIIPASDREGQSVRSCFKLVYTMRFPQMREFDRTRAPLGPSACPPLSLKGRTEGANKVPKSS